MGLGYTICHVVIFAICTAIVLTFGYLLFRFRREGRCVDIRNGIEFNTSFIRSQRACHELGYQWVFEPFNEDPRHRFDPLAYHRDRLLELMRRGEKEGKYYKWE